MLRVYKHKKSKIKNILFLVILLSSFSLDLVSQNITDFYYQLHRADLLVESGKLDSACILYDNACKNVTFIQSRILKKIIKVAKSSNNDDLVQYYKRKLKSQKDCPPQNVHILKEIDQLFELDQKVRSNKYWKAITYYNNHLNDTTLNHSTKFLKSKELRDYAVSVDSINILRMLNIIEQHGYLGEEDLGWNNHYKVKAILLHFDRDTNSLILEPILKNALTNNKITPFTYTHIVDRHLYNTSKTQRYWTWFLIDADPKLSQKEIERILKLREEIGLWGTEYSTSNYKGTWMLNNLSRSCY